MNKIKLLFFFFIINECVSQETRSVMLRKILHSQYQCNDVNCSPTVIYLVENVINCQIICLNDHQCRVATFDPEINECEIFSEISIEHGRVIEKTDCVTMTAIDDDRQRVSISVTTATTWTSNTHIPILSSSTTSTVKTQTITSTTLTTTSLNPCDQGNLRWNTRGITIFGPSSSMTVEVLYITVMNTVYLTDENSIEINGTIIVELIGSYEQNNQQFDYPNNAYIDKDGDLYVVDCTNNCVTHDLTNSATNMHRILVGSGDRANNSFITNVTRHSVMCWTPDVFSEIFVSRMPNCPESIRIDN
ncbi:hypothetical protein I4U23_011728 [Adineta vaga]|nr:hypothetical protein I4U23_011728 [Adineta vaga]